MATDDKPAFGGVNRGVGAAVSGGDAEGGVPLRPLSPPAPPPPPPPPPAVVTTREKDPPFEFRGFDFFAKRDYNDLKNATRSYFAPTAAAAAAGATRTGDPASWLGDETPPATPTEAFSDDREGRFPIPPTGRKRDRRRVLGLSMPCFWALLALLLLIIVVAVGVGVGVGVSQQSDGGGSKQAAGASPSSTSSSDGSSSSSTTAPTGTTSSPTTTTTTIDVAPTTTTHAVDCPGSNNTLYRVPGSTKAFLRVCGVDYSGAGEATDLGHVKTDTFDECIGNCATTAGCTGCGWGGPDYICWLKSNLQRSHDAAENWAFASLL
ncbi:hypothetical protein F4780DRAFT_31164 [Xylariomycetidae sp. FL0641]|nr:hypothetical protein F4780DRAFT_31164 [Xylariomycetidae sp. FL0641]